MDMSKQRNPTGLEGHSLPTSGATKNSTQSRPISSIKCWLLFFLSCSYFFTVSIYKVLSVWFFLGSHLPFLRLKCIGIIIQWLIHLPFSSCHVQPKHSWSRNFCYLSLLTANWDKTSFSAHISLIFAMTFLFSGPISFNSFCLWIMD